MKNDYPNLHPVTTSYETLAGWLNVTYDENAVYRAYFSAQPDASLASGYPLGETIREELQRYFSNPQYRFNLPLKPFGTPYQERVWQALQEIPVGYPVTYGELAVTLHSGPRAIGQACRTNPLALFIPCHRVVGKNNPGGYMGKAKALNFKEPLLNHEKAQH